jgi:dihydrolipoamide dehydrogenase
MSLIDILVPDIGDSKDVSVIELLVKAGDTITAEQSLMTVESDKASMEIPSTHSGTVVALKVKLGDKVNQGTVVLSLQTAAASASAAVSSTPITPPTPTMQQSSAAINSNDSDCDLLVLGAGPGGYSAAFRAADLGMKVILVERFATLGGVCLNVGCIPSKALLHVAAVMDEVKHFNDLGISFGAPQLDLNKLRTHKEKVIGKLTGGLAAMAKMRKVTVVQGRAQFSSPHHVTVENHDGHTHTIAFKQAVIAAGSEAVKLPFLPQEDARVVTSTGALALRQVPKRMLVIGGGIIGLEMGTVYSTLGARLDVVEMQDALMLGADRDLVKVWQKMNAPRFDHIMLKTKTVAAQATTEGILVNFEGEGAPKEPQLYDMVLQAVGRTPNGKRIAAEKAGVLVNERGFIAVDTQMRTNVPHIFAIGDIVGQPMLAHKAVHEAHVAAEVAAGHNVAFNARVIPSVAYTDPEIAWVGVTEDEARAKGLRVKKGLYPWSALGRAIANRRDEGFTKLLFDEDTHIIVGGGIVGTHAGDMIGEISLAIEMQADAVDIGKTIHAHPTLGESIGLAAEAFEGSCTDLPPVRR